MVFSNLNYSHKRALAVIRYVIRHRTIDLKEFSRVSKFSNCKIMEKIGEFSALEFPRALFIGLHNSPPVLQSQGSHRIITQVHYICYHIFYLISFCWYVHRPRMPWLTCIVRNSQTFLMYMFLSRRWLLQGKKQQEVPILGEMGFLCFKIQ